MEEEIKRYILADFEVKATDTFPDEIAVLKYGDVPVCTVGNISTIAGLPKTRKTFFVTALIKAFFSEWGGFSSEGEGGVLLFDTEQSKADVLRGIKRVFAMMNWPLDTEHPEFHTLATRECAPDDRMNLFLKAIINYQPQFVILDGFSDLLGDTNDLRESTEAVGWLMQLSTNHKCHIMTVLHTNPNTDKARGHAGSELQRKSESIFLLVKDERNTNVTPQYCRHEDFPKFSFRIENGIPIPVDYVATPRDSNSALFQSIFMSCEKLTYGDLKQQICLQLNIQGKTAEGRITKGLKLGLIERSSNGFYHLKYNEPELPPEGDLPD